MRPCRPFGPQRKASSPTAERVAEVRRLLDAHGPGWNAAVLGDDWSEEVARLRKELDGDIVVYGSRRLSRALIGMGLVDELRLMVYPLVLGAGDRLFGETPDKMPMRLVESRPLEKAW